MRHSTHTPLYGVCVCAVSLVGVTMTCMGCSDGSRATHSEIPQMACMLAVARSLTPREDGGSHQSGQAPHLWRCSKHAVVRQDGLAVNPHDDNPQKA